MIEPKPDRRSRGSLVLRLGKSLCWTGDTSARTKGSTVGVPESRDPLICTPTSWDTVLGSVLVAGSAWALSAYKVLISPVLPGACRYLPTCSEYAREAVARHGVVKGWRLALARVLRCHPFGGSGQDPVP